MKMKQLAAAAASFLAFSLASAPAYADAALPPRYTLFNSVLKWTAAFAVALVIIAVAVIVAVIRHKRK